MKQGLLVVLSLIALTSLCDTVSQIFLKSGIDFLNFKPTLNIRKIFKFIFQLISMPRLWLGFIFSLLSLCVWLVVLSKADLNFAFSADSMHYIFIAMASKIILKERFSSMRWWGTGLIVIGIVIVSLG